MYLKPVFMLENLRYPYKKDTLFAIVVQGEIFENYSKLIRK